MRFPWLQVDADFIGAHAGDLGAHLGISRREAIGLAVDLWTWALARARDDAPPDGIVTGTGAVPDRLLSGSVGWTGPVEQFTEALVAVGMAVRIDGGYRLTGFSRYRSTWEKNRRRTGEKPERNRSGTGGEPARKTQTQTQTQTQKEETTLSARPEASPQASGEESDVTHRAEEVPNAVAAFVAQAPLLPEADATPPEKPAPKGPDPEALRALWNRLAPPKGLARWEAMNKARTAAAKASLLEVPDLGKWEAWLTHELDRPFNRGGNSSGWRADVDWLLRAKTRGLVADFDPSTAAKPAPTGDRPRLGPPAAPPRVSGDRPRI